MPANGSELVDYGRREGAIGAWANRDDIGDRADYARRLRHAAESRGTAVAAGTAATVPAEGRA